MVASLFTYMPVSVRVHVGVLTHESTLERK